MIADVWARHIAFVLRCSGAAALAFYLASGAGMAYPAWASISALIVSQERLRETKSAMIGRFAGTLSGICMSIVVGTALQQLGADVAVQMAFSVGLCAAVARRYPILRVGMWTAPIVFLSGAPGTSLLDAGLWRGAEVILGGLVGAALHLLAEILILPISGKGTDAEDAPGDLATEAQRGAD